MIAAWRQGLVAAAGSGLPALVTWLLARTEAAFAGRAYTACGGVYAAAAALAWMWVVEGIKPDRWNLAGGALCLAGCLVILLLYRA